MADLTRLKSIARDILTLVSDESKSVESISKFLNPSITLSQDDNPPITGSETLIAAWNKAKASAPGFKYEMKDMIAEGNKVWVWSEISVPAPPGGVAVVKDSVGMFNFDEEGKVFEIRNLQRIKGMVGS